MRRDKGSRLRSGAGTGIFLALLLALAPGAAQASWWNDQWAFRRPVQVQPEVYQLAAGTVLTEVPVLLRLHPGNFDFDLAQENGSDLRVLAADDQTPLSIQIETYDPAAQMALVWVKLPRLEAGRPAGLWLYYGSQGAEPAKEAGSSFDVAQALVYHLSEVSGPPRDATAYKRHAEGFQAIQGVAGIAGKGVTVSAGGDHLSLPPLPGLDKSGFTFATWIRLAAPAGEAPLFTIAGVKTRLVLGIAGTTPQVRLDGQDKARTPELAAGTPLTPGTWQHLCLTAAPGGDLVLFLDGTEVGRQPLAGSLPEGLQLRVAGSLPDRTAPETLAADLDEISLAGVPRPPEWVRLQAVNQGQEAGAPVVGPQEVGNQPMKELVYLKTVLDAITLDGWVIIGLLILMGAVGWVTLFSKTLSFRIMGRQNEAFLALFDQQPDFLAVAARHDGDFANAPLFRVYEAGCRELAGRLDRQGAARLSPRAMQVVRTAVEQAYVEETNAFSARLPFLVMSVSGGPFLGLLGTVWGVMSTFAAMANAGEANLAAIAPGIASALATTVFGLIVAIPALFAYNYLAGSVKAMTTELGIFTDRLLAMVDERYGESSP
ncbi:MAG: DUF2341 domain-containing protein [Thermodesulfobacteriota bacterium]